MLTSHESVRTCSSYLCCGKYWYVRPKDIDRLLFAFSAPCMEEDSRKFARLRRISRIQPIHCQVRQWLSSEQTQRLGQWVWNKDKRAISCHHLSKIRRELDDRSSSSHSREHGGREAHPESGSPFAHIFADQSIRMRNMHLEYAHVALVPRFRLQVP